MAETPERRVVDGYLAAADVALALLADPAVAARWADASALAGLTVGGLAAHLAGQLTGVRDSLVHPVTGPVVDLSGHYGRSQWLGAPLDSEVNTAIREGGERNAEGGAAAVLADASAARAALAARLPTTPVDTPVQPTWLAWALPLSDFLTVRQLEIVVHADDLAVSVGAPTPQFPEDVADRVVGLLARLAVQRHGVVPVVRALSRAERAPASISAL